MQKRLATVNETRHLRTLHPGETVFRRMPAKARAPKHLLGEPSRGPYVVVSQSTVNSAKLRDPATGQLVDKGADIPLEQILAGPRQVASSSGHLVRNEVLARWSPERERPFRRK